jgi:hypothetical protein
LAFCRSPLFEVTGVRGRAEPIERNGLEGLTSSVSGWASSPSY